MPPPVIFLLCQNNNFGGVVGFYFGLVFWFGVCSGFRLTFGLIKGVRGGDLNPLAGFSILRKKVETLKHNHSSEFFDFPQLQPQKL
jgi:hypothetical protein